MITGKSRCRMPQIGATLLGLLALVLAASGCAPAGAPVADQAPTRTDGPLHLTLLHTNDTWGYLLPCG